MSEIEIKLANFLYVRTGYKVVVNQGKAVINDEHIKIVVSSQGNTVELEYIYLPYKFRGQGVGNLIISQIIQFMRIRKFEYMVLYPFPSDPYDDKMQTYGKINKLVRYYKKFGFRLTNEADFKGCFSSDSGRINYKLKSYYSDLCGCNMMELKL